jgi:rubredoxin
MTQEEKDAILERSGMRCPLCGMKMIDLEHDGVSSTHPHYHDFFCTNCNIQFDVFTLGEGEAPVAPNFDDLDDNWED